MFAFIKIYLFCLKSVLLTKVYLNIVFAKKAAIIVKNNFNCCKYIDADFYFYQFYYTIIIEKKISKFGFANYINILP